jgi:hypothetical protein
LLGAASGPQELVFYRKAAVHNDGDPGRLELSCYLIVPYALLQPDQLWMYLE